MIRLAGKNCRSKSSKFGLRENERKIDKLPRSSDEHRGAASERERKFRVAADETQSQYLRGFPAAPAQSCCLLQPILFDENQAALRLVLPRFGCSNGNVVKLLEII